MRITVDYIRFKVKKSETLTAEEKLFIGHYGVERDLSVRDLAAVFLIGKSTAQNKLHQIVFKGAQSPSNELLVDRPILRRLMKKSSNR